MGDRGDDLSDDRVLVQNLAKGLKEDVAIRKVLSLDEGVERQKIEAVK